MRNYQKKINQFFQSGFQITFCLFVFLTGFGEISLKTLDIPFSIGGGLEKIIIWPFLFAFGYILSSKKAVLKQHLFPISISFSLILWIFLNSKFHLPCPEGKEYLMIFVVGCLTFLMGIISLNNEYFLKKILLCLIFGGLGALFKGFIYFYYPDIFPEHQFLLNDSETLRIFSPIGHPNFFGNFMMLLIPFSFSFKWTSGKNMNLVLKICVTALLFTGLILSYSRTAWISVLFGILFFTILHKRKLLPPLIIFFLILFNVLIFKSNKIKTFQSDNPVMQRVLSFQDFKNDDNLVQRIYCWRTSISIIKNNFFSGIGPGNERFMKEYARYHLKQSQMIMPHPHNLFLHIFTSFGFPGFLLFMLIMTGGIISSIQKLKQPDNLNHFSKFLLQASLTSIFMLTIYGMIDSPVFAERLSPLIWLILSFLYIKKVPE